MKPELPQPADVMRAVDVYISVAYDGRPTTVVRSMLSTLRTWAGPFFNSPVWVKTGDDPERQRYAMRLGNKDYPHMKLVLEAAPDGSKYLLKADTHDRHICPASDTPEYEPFVRLMKQNQETAERIESAWSESALPTFKAFLREDLARRQQVRA
jgi:hypothetical protein